MVSVSEIHFSEFALHVEADRQLLDESRRCSQWTLPAVRRSRVNKPLARQTHVIPLEAGSGKAISFRNDIRSSKDHVKLWSGSLFGCWCILRSQSWLKRKGSHSWLLLRQERAEFGDKVEQMAAFQAATKLDI